MRQAKRRPKDAQIEEFESKDLGRDIARSRSAVLINRPGRRVATSILLDPALIDKLKQKAAKRGIGYQTMLKIIVYEHVDEY